MSKVEMKNGGNHPKTQVVQGVELASGFWFIRRKDEEFAYLVKNRRRHQTLIIPLDQLTKLEIVERRVAV